jgi:hypothetical protein
MSESKETVVPTALYHKAQAEIAELRRQIKAQQAEIEALRKPKEQ